MKRSAPLAFAWLVVLGGVIALAGAGRLSQPEGGAPGSPPPPAGGPAQPQAQSPHPPAQPEVIVYLKDGKRVSGLLVSQTPEAMVLRIAGIDTTIEASRIERHQVLPSVLERYQQIREAIGDDAEQIVTLADWLRQREQLDLALAEVERALRIEPGRADAKKLHTLITQQIQLRARSRPQDRQKPDSVPRGAQPGAPKPPDDSVPLLTPDQVNLIKVYEVDLDNPPRLVIKRETIERLIESRPDSSLIPATQEGRDAIYRWPAARVLELMFRLQARDLYPEVEVLDQPRAMQLFRDEVNAAWLINSCATAQCHGGSEAGRFRLANRRPRADATVYTNFLILDRFRLDDGTAMINYDNPDRSPLLHLALPREDSLFPHPPVRRGAASVDSWRRVFRSTDDRMFRATVQWINAMYRPRPNYPIEYRPAQPLQPPTPAPAEPPPR
jgi:hypothetical protein